MSEGEKGMDRLLNMVLRGCLGMVGIYLCNMILVSQGCEYFGAINIVTFLLCSFVGLPGIVVVFFVTFVRATTGI
ncbi:MAG: hypothetical protein E7288_03110 [Lachnospiraceae bacterium]|nr:hypothetical protein [Lachnospiraceae bacterium]